jgi:hypothetical protein
VTAFSYPDVIDISSLSSSESLHEEAVAKLEPSETVRERWLSFFFWIDFFYFLFLRLFAEGLENRRRRAAHRAEGGQAEQGAVTRGEAGVR